MTLGCHVYSEKLQFGGAKLALVLVSRLLKFKFLSTQVHNENEDLCCFCRKETKKYIEKKEIGPIFDFFFQFFYFTVRKLNPHAQNDLKNGRSGLLEAVTQVKRDIFDNSIYGYGATFY